MSGTQTLLADYVKNGSEGAFRDLVTSYIDFVFATALRVVGGDRPLAEDVSQTVFTDLARKAVTLPRDVKLGGWLHRHTCFVGRKALRRERRRIARERQAMQLTTIEDYTEENLGQLSTILDETINGLGKEDRNAIILRFFEQLDYRALGAALGSTEDAARMRVSRALEKMGAILRRRGIAMSAGGLSFVLSTKTAAAAPVGLAAKVSQLALAQSLKGWAALSFLKDACLTRLNLGIAGGVAVVMAVLILLIPARHTQAVLDLSKEVKQPVDFAGLADEESEAASPAEQASITPPPAPAPSQAPATIPAVWKPVAVVTFPKTNASPGIEPSPATPSPAPQPAPPTASAANPAVPTSSSGGQSFGSGSAQASVDVFGPSLNRRYGQPPAYPPPTSQPVAPNLTAATKAAAPSTNVIPKMIVPPPSTAYPGGVQVAAPAPNPQIGNPPASLVLRGNRNNQNNRQRQPP